MMDAGFNSTSGFIEYSVSPRVTEVTITPQTPLRVCARSTEPRSAASAGAERGDEYEDATGVAARAVRTGVRRALERRRVGWRRCAADSGSPTARKIGETRTAASCAPPGAPKAAKATTAMQESVMLRASRLIRMRPGG